MRARTITTIVVLCALAIPVSASAGSSDYSSVNSITGGSSQSSQPVSGGLGRTPTEIGQAVGETGDPGQPAAAQDVSSGYSSLNSITGPPSSEPTPVAGSPASTDDGFDWLSAAIGAAAAMALVALGGAAFLTVRKRTAVAPSAASLS